MVKIREFPKKSEPVAYQAYLHTIGRSKVAEVIMIELKTEYEKGNDYFGLLKQLKFYFDIVNEIKNLKNEKLRLRISKDYFQKTKENILQSKYPKTLESHSLCILTTTYRNYLKKSNNETLRIPSY